MPNASLSDMQDIRKSTVLSLEKYNQDLKRQGEMRLGKVTRFIVRVNVRKAKRRKENFSLLPFQWEVREEKNVHVRDLHLNTQ